MSAPSAFRCKRVLPRLLLFVGGGIVTLAWCEFAFYRGEQGVFLPAMVLVYGFGCYLFFVVLVRTSAPYRHGLFLAAGLFGFVIEGVVVPVLYDTLPFSIVWTSLAWHGLISVLFCLVVFRRWMRAWRWPARLALCAGLGMAQGLWACYTWLNTDAGVFPADVALIAPYTGQAVLGFGLFAAGHLVLDRVGAERIGVIGRDLWPVVGAIGGVWLLGQFWPRFPASLLLPALGVLTLLALRRLAPGAAADILAPVPLGHCAVVPALPMCSIAAFAWGQQNGLIPTCTDQHSCAHLRIPMDLMRAGWAISLFQASQQ